MKIRMDELVLCAGRRCSSLLQCPPAPRQRGGAPLHLPWRRRSATPSCDRKERIRGGKNFSIPSPEETSKKRGRETDGLRRWTVKGRLFFSCARRHTLYSISESSQLRFGGGGLYPPSRFSPDQRSLLAALCNLFSSPKTFSPPACNSTYEIFLKFPGVQYHVIRSLSLASGCDVHFLLRLASAGAFPLLAHISRLPRGFSLTSKKYSKEREQARVLQFSMQGSLPGVWRLSSQRNGSVQDHLTQGRKY